MYRFINGTVKIAKARLIILLRVTQLRKPAQERKVNKLTKTLSDMTVTEAASKAIELIVYGKYTKACGPQKYGTPFEGTFEEYFNDYIASDIFDGDDNYFDPEREDYFPLEEIKNYDLDRVWQNLHDDGAKGRRDGWTGEVVTSYGGEGGGDQYWMVISVSDGETTRYFRKDGWYASYDGGYLDGETYEVTPKERTVVFYE
jgi:hypothetical protein